MTLAVDCSNYSVDPLPIARFQAAGVGLIIIQAFPTSYSQYAKQTRQVQQCAAAGLPFDFYVYDYLASPGWRDGAIEGIRQLANQGYVARRIWADEEDVDSSAQRMTVAQRVSAVAASLRALDLAPSRLNPTGVYTGSWWWKPYTGNTAAFSDRLLWNSNYDGVADPAVDHALPFGGWTWDAIKQYAGTQPDGTDLDVLSAEEVGQLSPQTEVQPNMAIHVGAGMQAQMATNQDVPLFGHKFYSEVDDDGHTYNVEQCYGARGLYASSDSSGAWVNAGPF